MINITITGSATGYIIRDSFPWASVIFVSFLTLAYFFVRRYRKLKEEKLWGIY
jgi:hypothetical protein